MDAGGNVVLSGDALRFDGNGTLIATEGGMSMSPEVTGIAVASTYSGQYICRYYPQSRPILSQIIDKYIGRSR